jgi:hypothetical protein
MRRCGLPLGRSIGDRGGELVPVDDDSDAKLITSAVAEAWMAAGCTPTIPPATGVRPRIAPTPLLKMMVGFDVILLELANLTRATAAEQRPELRIARPELVGDQTPLAGLLAVSSAAACILLRKNDPIARRRFSAAHELGHLLMHFRPPWLPGGRQQDVVTDDGPREILEDETPSTELNIRERQANRFAAELLMPDAVCRGLHAFYADRYGTTPRFLEGHMAGDLAVSRQAIRLRLTALKLGVDV